MAAAPPPSSYLSAAGAAPSLRDKQIGEDTAYSLNRLRHVVASISSCLRSQVLEKPFSIVGEETLKEVVLLMWRYVFFLCTGAIKRMLNLNSPLPKSQSAAEPVWKVLCICA